MIPVLIIGRDVVDILSVGDNDCVVYDGTI